MEEHAKTSVKKAALWAIENWGKDNAVMVINTEDRIYCEEMIGEDLDPGIEGIVLVDDFDFPTNSLNVICRDKFFEWQERKVFSIEYGQKTT